MKKLTVAMAAAIVLAFIPVEASAHGKKYRHNHRQVDATISIGGGVVAGAVVAGPVGAVIGGVAGVLALKVHRDRHHR